MFARALLLLLLSLAGAALGQIICTNIDTVNAKGTCNAVVYDLSQMVSPGGSHDFVAQGPDDYNYFLQMTGGGLPQSQAGCPFPPGLDYGNAVGQGTTQGDWCYPCGLVSEQQWTLVPSKPQVLTVTFSGGQDGRVTSLMVTCNPTTKGTFIARGETLPGSKIYELDMQSCAACAEGCGPPPPPPPPTCALPPQTVGWPVARGSSLGVGQSLSTIPTSMTVTARTYAYSTQGYPVVGGNHDVYIAADFGVLVISGGQTTNVIRLGGQQVPMGVALISNPTYPVLAILASGGQFVSTTVYFYVASPLGLLGSVPIVGAPGTAGIITVADGTPTVVASVGNKVFAVSPAGQGELLWLSDALDSDVGSFVIGPNSSFVAVSTATTLYALSMSTGLVSWSIPGSASSLIAYIDTIGLIFSNGTTAFLDPATGFTKYTLPKPCTSSLTVTADCHLFCFSTSDGMLRAFIPARQVLVWQLALGANLQVDDMVVDNNTLVLVYHSSQPGSESVGLTAVSYREDERIWTTSFPGTSGRLAVNGNNQLEVLVLGNSTYLYTISPSGVRNAGSRTTRQPRVKGTKPKKIVAL